jgi:hypothetical protein
VHAAVAGRTGSRSTDPRLTAQDSAAGWTLANPLDWAYLCARLPDKGAEEIYSNGANVVIAAQFGRPMRAIPAEGGYRITGRSPFVSNCHDANWIATTAMVMAADQSRPEGEPETVMAYLPRESCEIIDTWSWECAAPAATMLR